MQEGARPPLSIPRVLARVRKSAPLALGPGTEAREGAFCLARYPSRLEGRKGIGDRSRYLPINVQRVPEETLKALNSRSPILAGIGLRALIETVCKAEEFSGHSLLEKIDDLTTKKVLTLPGLLSFTD
jgi:hypothetical protein